MLALRSLSSGPLMALTNVFLLNTIEYGEYKTGIRADSLIVTVSGFGNKVGMGLGAALIGWLLAFGGFISNSEIQPETIGNTIVLIYCLIPAIIAGFQITALLFYDLDKHYDDIVNKLKLKRNGITAA